MDKLLDKLNDLWVDAGLKLIYVLIILIVGIVWMNKGDKENTTNSLTQNIEETVENDEEPSEGFAREVLEETGCKIDIIKKLGVTEEYISMKGAKQISHIFVAKVRDNTNVLSLTEKEKSEGAKLIWVTPQEALRLMENSYNKLTPSTYENDYDVYRMKFISLRDRKILEYYIVNNK